MKNLIPIIFAWSVIVNFTSCKTRTQPVPVINPDLQGSVNQFSKTTFDSLAVDSFFVQFPELGKYADDVKIIYRGYNYHHIWFDEKGILEFANSLYGKVKGIASEGIYEVFPYPGAIDMIFEAGMENTYSRDETEIMITSMYLFYAEKVYNGIDDKTVAAIEWLLPKKKVSYENVLDSLMLNSGLLTRNDSVLISQYYKLREGLQYYREIQKKGGWDTIFIDPKIKSYKPGDSALPVQQIRKRLFMTGDISENNLSNVYDSTLLSGVNKFQLRNGRKEQPAITPQLIKLMNVPVDELIRKIAVNMERWRWVTPDLANSKEYIFVNIPSYMLTYNRDGQKVLEMPVVVGKNMNKTVIFSGNMSFIVFSPYWNVPPGIFNSEVKPGIKKDKNYLAKHNMEWHNGQVRQKPGRSNSLGLVKFLFPNSNNIYLHDTPSKSYFSRDSRAFSHGCVRVGKPRDLAIEILKNDPEWTPGKIDAAMKGGVEKWVALEKKIPVHIGYFTAWVNDSGEMNFYEDVYDMDGRLFDILIGYDDGSGVVTQR